MVPTFAIFEYVIVFLLQNMDAAIWIPLFSLPFIKAVLPKAFKPFVYRAAISFFLFIFLYAELSVAGLLGNFADPSLFGHLITFTFILSIEISLAFIIMMEGAFTDKPGKAITYMLASFFLMVEQLSAVYLYQSPMFPVYYSALVPYLSSLPVVPASGFQFAYEINFLMQYYAIYTLLFLGAEGIPLPLSVIFMPYDYVILASLVVSFTAIYMHFSFNGEKIIKYRLSGAAFAGIFGILIAIISMIVMRIFQYSNYQFFMLSLIIASFWIVAASVVKKASRNEITNI